MLALFPQGEEPLVEALLGGIFLADLLGGVGFSMPCRPRMDMLSSKVDSMAERDLDASDEEAVLLFLAL